MHDRKSWLWIASLIVITRFSAAYLLTRDAVTLPILFGDKQVAFFDLWSLQHFASGVMAGAVFRKTRNPLLFTLLGACVWEGSEWWAEDGGAGIAIATWKAGYEHWSNRLISDPIMAILGARLYARHPRALWIAILWSAMWSTLNASAPTCTSVQQMIIAFFTTT